MNDFASFTKIFAGSYFGNGINSYKRFLMLNKSCKFRSTILIVLSILGTVNLSLLTNIKTLAQAQSDSTTTSLCIGINIESYIRQAENSSSSAFSKLVECNLKSIPYLVKALESKDEKLRVISIAALGEIDANAAPTPYLTQSLKDNSKDVRIITVYALEKIGKYAVPALITVLKDENSDVRRSAADALREIGTDAKSAVPALITALKDENYDVRSGAANALGAIGSDAKSAIPTLITALKDENYHVRWRAADALWKIAKDAKSVVPVLAQVFLKKNENICIRKQAIKLLKHIGSSEAILVLQRNKETVYYIYKRTSYSCDRTSHRANHRHSSLLRRSSITYEQDNPPVMCRIPVIKSVLSWKCPQDSLPSQSYKKPEYPKPQRNGGNSSSTTNPCKNCSNPNEKK